MRFVALLLVSVLYGIVVGALFRRVPVRPVLNRILAHVLSFGLFIDEPRLVFRAQWELLREHLRLARLLALPLLISGVAFLAIAHAFAKGPIPPGETFVLTALPPGVEAETPPVHVARLRQIVWRVHAVRPFLSGLDAPYPAAHWFGLHWLVWFIALSTLAITLATAVRRI